MLRQMLFPTPNAGSVNLVPIMAGRGKDLFNQLQAAEAIRGLIGQTEDVHLDCKEWPASDGDAQKVFAKAACGLTNAEGGVILVGMKARAMSKDEPDLIESVAPVTDTIAVKSRILDLVGQLVEPRIEGVQISEVREPAGSRSGFVVVYIPASEGPPRRSRKIGNSISGLAPELFQWSFFKLKKDSGRGRPQNWSCIWKKTASGSCLLHHVSEGVGL